MDRIGPYEILDELGRGGLGVVYRARDPALRRDVAIKVVLNLQAEEQHRFVDEARALVRVRDPGLVQVLHADLAGGHPYLVMDIVPGESLGARIKRGPVEPREVVRIGVELVRVLEQLHAARIVHRDLKPGNIILRPDGQPVLLDLGLVLILDRSSRLTRSGEMMGTPGYMSPEQAEGRTKEMGPAADVYGLGATLYALVTGQAPFVGASVLNILHAMFAGPPRPPSSLRPGISPALDQILLRCLAKEPKARPSLAEVRDELVALQLRESGHPTDGTRSRSRAGAAVGLGVLVLVASVAAIVLRGSEQGEEVASQLPAVSTAPDKPPPIVVDVVAPPSSSSDVDATPSEEWADSTDIVGLRAAANQGSAEAMNRLGRLYTRGEGVSQDLVEAARWFKRAADAGHAPAMVNLAVICESISDIDQAVSLYTQAARTGDTTAMNCLGDLYSAEGPRRDYGEAARWYHLGAEAGNFDAMMMLASLYVDGRGVPQDMAAAAEWYRRVSEAGHMEGTISLGSLYLQGDGDPQNQREGARLLRLAVDAGEPRAMCNLGTLLLDGGQGVDQDLGEAARLFRMAADAGYANAMRNLGQMYASGRGVPRDLAEAARWHRRASDAGLPRSTYLLAQYYENGTGVAQDRTEAAKLYERAARPLRAVAESGDPRAMVEVGDSYAHGRGVAEDSAEAARWWQRALDAGNGSVRFSLGLAYYDGVGVPRDVERARTFMSGDNGVNATYAALYAYLCDLELGKKDEGRARLAQFAEQRRPQGWEAGLVAGMLGDRSEGELLQLAATAADKKPIEARCEVAFYLGMRVHLLGNRTHGEELLRNCVATGLTDFTEHRSARAMLERLERQEEKR